MVTHFVANGFSQPVEVANAGESCHLANLFLHALADDDGVADPIDLRPKKGAEKAYEAPEAREECLRWSSFSGKTKIVLVWKNMCFPFLLRITCAFFGNCAFSESMLPVLVARFLHGSQSEGIWLAARKGRKSGEPLHFASNEWVAFGCHAHCHGTLFVRVARRPATRQLQLAPNQTLVRFFSERPSGGLWSI